MKINVDRLCELAGIPGVRTNRGGIIREAYEGADPEAAHEADIPAELDGVLGEEADLPAGLEDVLAEADDEEENEGMHADHDTSEMLDIDEADLVKELRRIKVKMHEARKIEKRRQEDLQESQLKAIIDQEVKNVLKELNLNSGWVYGNKKPKNSRHGYTHQGSFLKGMGFK